MLLYIDPGTGSMLFAAIMGIVSTVFFLIRKVWITLKFRLGGGRSVKDDSQYSIVIFNEGKQYWNIFEPICDELERRGVEAEYYTADEADEGLKKEYEHIHSCFIGSGNKAFAKMNLLNAKVCLATTPGLGVYQWKRSKEVGNYVHIFHALTSGTGYRMFGLDEYDVVLLSGPLAGEHIRRLEEIRNSKPKRMEVVGAPFMDRLLKRRIDEEEKKHKKTVLLAPTWGGSSIFARFSHRMIDALLMTDYEIIIRPHPQSLRVEKEQIEELKGKYSNENRIKWDTSPDNFLSLNEADILISDFSGVMFDFALGFDRPVIYTDTEYDSSVYDQAWLEGTPLQFQFLPDIGIQLREEDFDHMQQIMDDLIVDDTYKKGRDYAREQLWQYPGESAGRVADILVEIAGQEEEDR